MRQPNCRISSRTKLFFPSLYLCFLNLCSFQVVFLSGKHCYTLLKARDERKISDVAFVRLESLCPFPVQELREAIAKYPNAESKFLLL